MGHGEQTKRSHEEMEEHVRSLEAAFHECRRLAVANRYAAAVMHEVNNPLEAITNLIYLTKGEEISEAALANLQIMEQQLEVLTRVTRSSLSFHRDQLRMKDVDLVEVAESALKIHSSRIATSDIEVSRRYSETARCSGISSEILQVISNLVLNAVEAMPTDTGGRLHLRIHRLENAVHITVADNGCGVPEHVAPHLFQPHVTGKQTGTGLGLWLCESIVTKHRGTMRYRTSRREGKSGTVFRISLPHAEPTH